MFSFRKTIPRLPRYLPSAMSINEILPKHHIWKWNENITNMKSKKIDFINTYTWKNGKKETQKNYTILCKMFREKLRTQAKLDKTEKLWHLLLCVFWALVPKIYFCRGDWALGCYFNPLCSEWKLYLNFIKFQNATNATVGSIVKKFIYVYLKQLVIARISLSQTFYQNKHMYVDKIHVLSEITYVKH